MGDRASSQREYYDSFWSKQRLLPHQNVPSSLAALLERHARPGDECLDVGCGRGDGAGTWLAQNTASYLGVDVSDTALQAARTKGLNVQHIADASELPFADGTFDLAVCIEVLVHLLEPHLAAKEILRVLRPGGRLIATVPNVAYWRRRADLAVLGRWNPLGDNESAYRPWRDPHVRFFGRANLRDMLRDAGFDPVVTGGHGASWMADVPGIRSMMKREAPGPIYARLVHRLPSVFAHHIHAIGTKSLDFAA